jgi:hypothetical protein
MTERGGLRNGGLWCHILQNGRLGEFVSKKMAYASVVCSLIAAWSNLATASENSDNRRYRTVWNIKLDEKQAGQRSIAHGQPILEQRLLPAGLAVTDEDVHAENGDVLVNKGVQLFQLQVASGKTFCVADVPRPSAFRSLMLGGGNLQLCLVDVDADGVFDGHFNGGNPMRGIPFITGRQPKEPKKATGRYSLADPNLFSLKYTVRIALVTAKTRDSGEPLIAYRIDFGDDQTRQGLTNIVAGKLGHNSILGAEWNVAEIGENSLKANITHAMPHQPFEVTRTISYR